MARRDAIVQIHRAEEGGYWAEVTEYPACHTLVATMDEFEEIARHVSAARVVTIPLPKRMQTSTEREESGTFQVNHLQNA